uniref:Uncharacterized protein n=1 Tax=Amazona collaria TaxID=241587 RepID=A0A8B9FF65_9PSIT
LTGPHPCPSAPQPALADPLSPPFSRAVLLMPGFGRLSRGVALSDEGTWVPGVLEEVTPRSPLSMCCSSACVPCLLPLGEVVSPLLPPPVLGLSEVPQYLSGLSSTSPSMQFRTLLIQKGCPLKT